MSAIIRRIAAAEAKAAAVAPDAQMSIEELRARAAELQAELCAAWGIAANASLDVFLERLAAEPHPGAARGASIVRDLAARGVL